MAYLRKPFPPSWLGGLATVRQGLLKVDFDSNTTINTVLIHEENQTMKIQPDGSILIHAALDGPFEQIVSSKVDRLIADLLPKKVKGVETPTLFQHQIEHGRPGTPNAATRQEIIKRLIRELQSRNPTLTFVQAWTRLQQQRPELFD